MSFAVKRDCLSQSCPQVTRNVQVSRRKKAGNTIEFHIFGGGLTALSRSSTTGKDRRYLLYLEK